MHPCPLSTGVCNNVCGGDGGVPGKAEYDRDHQITNRLPNNCSLHVEKSDPRRSRPAPQLPKVANMIWPMWAVVQQRLANAAPKLARFGQVWPDLGNCWAKLVNTGKYCSTTVQMMAKFDRSWSMLARCCSTCSKLGPNGLDNGPHRPEIASRATFRLSLDYV